VARVITFGCGVKSRDVLDRLAYQPFKGIFGPLGLLLIGSARLLLLDCSARFPAALFSTDKSARCSIGFISLSPPQSTG
jgi:hypothetical protein